MKNTIEWAKVAGCFVLAVLGFYLFVASMSLVWARVALAVVAVVFIAYAVGEASASGEKFWPRVWASLKPWVILVAILYAIAIMARWS